MTLRLFPLAACLALALPGCSPADTAAAAPPAPAAAATRPDTSATGAASPYRFDQPVARFEMPDELREISALTVLDADHVGAVQDEEGTLYVIEFATGRVSAVVPFGPPGDYEGVELAEGRLFVLRADGAILELAGWMSGRETTARVYETGLGARACDGEGLGYDAARQQLLVSCKEETDGRNPVYGFSLATTTVTDAPVYQLDPSAVPGRKKLAPSALAVHPLTGHTVVISSKRDALISIDASGAVVGTWDLSLAGLPQPEGLTFLPNGDALVSSEGKDGPGVIVRFAYDG